MKIREILNENPEAEYWAKGGLCDRNGCSYENEEAIRAFNEGRNYQPSTFQYGTNTGDYVTPLFVQDGVLCHARVRQSRETVYTRIAQWREIKNE